MFEGSLLASDEHVLALIDGNADVDSSNANHQDYTALHYAAATGNASLVAALLARNATVDASTSESLTPLQLASGNNHDVVVRLLVEHAADVNHVTSRTALQRAVANNNLALVEFLVDKRANVALVSGSGTTALHDAVYCTHLDIARYLVQHGALRESGTDEHAVTPSIDQQTPLHLSAIRHKNDLLALLIDNKAAVDTYDVYGESPLLDAIEYRNDRAAELLIDAGASVNAEQQPPRTRRPRLYQRPTYNKQAPLYRALLTGSESVVHKLLDAKADVNATDVNGNTPLHAASLDSTRTRLLLEHAADPNRANEQGATPLHAACWWSVACASALIDAKANINAVDNEQQSPLHVALQQSRQEIATYLVEHGADSNLQNVCAAPIALISSSSSSSSSRVHTLIG
jgi:ankyrin repeat protein